MHMYFHVRTNATGSEKRAHNFFGTPTYPFHINTENNETIMRLEIFWLNLAYMKVAMSTNAGGQYIQMLADNAYIC